MSTLHIRRSHSLGLDRAREVATQWTQEARSQWAMTCQLTSEPHQDTVSFSRAGVAGTLQVTADAFELQAQLGFLMTAFAPAIETEVSRNLDRLLGTAS